jgi:hypothetical protein
MEVFVSLFIRLTTGTEPRRAGDVNGECAPEGVRRKGQRKGQIGPGSPMPAITLKGVNIKGQSEMGYQEAVSAAQSAAQSALDQDQVPRASIKAPRGITSTT